MKSVKTAVIISALAAIVTAGSTVAFAAGNDVSAETITPELLSVEEDAELNEQEEDSVDKTEYGYNAGRAKSAARNEQYSELPTGGTKEDAQAFYDSHDVGGGAWVDGEYDESAKTEYGYAAGRQRNAEYAQESDDSEFETQKSGYSYAAGRQSYLDNYPNYSK